MTLFAIGNRAIAAFRGEVAYQLTEDLLIPSAFFLFTVFLGSVAFLWHRPIFGICIWAIGFFTMSFVIRQSFS